MNSSSISLVAYFIFCKTREKKYSLEFNDNVFFFLLLVKGLLQDNNALHYLSSLFSFLFPYHSRDATFNPLICVFWIRFKIKVEYCERDQI